MKHEDTNGSPKTYKGGKNFLRFPARPFPRRMRAQPDSLWRLQQGVVNKEAFLLHHHPRGSS